MCVYVCLDNADDRISFGYHEKEEKHLKNDVNKTIILREWKRKKTEEARERWRKRAKEETQKKRKLDELV